LIGSHSPPSGRLLRSFTPPISYDRRWSPPPLTTLHHLYQGTIVTVGTNLSPGGTAVSCQPHLHRLRHQILRCRRLLVHLQLLLPPCLESNSNNSVVRTMPVTCSPYGVTRCVIHLPFLMPFIIDLFLFFDY
jgi:hypothetical protein